MLGASGLHRGEIPPCFSSVPDVVRVAVSFALNSKLVSRTGMPACLSGFTYVPEVAGPAL